jgi:predicted RNA-binding Zn ribbon-like protein
VKSLISKQRAGSRLQFLAGDLALDFLNTRVRVGGEIRDLLQTDEDVLAWLQQAGLPAPKAAPQSEPLLLLRAARSLRENIRLLLEKRKARRLGDPSVLNEFLAFAQSHPELIWDRANSLTIRRVWQRDGNDAGLARIAEAAAALLATADFNLVKRCEGETCILWFLDQTKSHHRRWCSTKTCGNRHKVAAYRKRLRDHLASRA